MANKNLLETQDGKCDTLLFLGLAWAKTSQLNDRLFINLSDIVYLEKKKVLISKNLNKNVRGLTELGCCFINEITLG